MGNEKNGVVSLHDLRFFCEIYNDDITGCDNCPLDISNLCPIFRGEPFCDIDMDKVSTVIRYNLEDQE